MTSKIHIENVVSESLTGMLAQSRVTEGTVHVGDHVLSTSHSESWIVVDIETYRRKVLELGEGWTGTLFLTSDGSAVPVQVSMLEHQSTKERLERA